MAKSEAELRGELGAAKAAQAAAFARADRAGFGAANAAAKQKQSELSREICKAAQPCPVCGRAPFVRDVASGLEIACANRAEHASVVTAPSSAAAIARWNAGNFDAPTVKGANRG